MSEFTDFERRTAGSVSDAASETDPAEIIKWKDLYELLESAIDRCEDVANIVETIAIKHA